MLEIRGLINNELIGYVNNISDISATLNIIYDYKLYYNDNEINTSYELPDNAIVLLYKITPIMEIHVNDEDVIREHLSDIFYNNVYVDKIVIQVGDEKCTVIDIEDDDVELYVIIIKECISDCTDITILIK